MVLSLWCEHIQNRLFLRNLIHKNTKNNVRNKPFPITRKKKLLFLLRCSFPCIKLSFFFFYHSTREIYVYSPLSTICNSPFKISTITSWCVVFQFTPLCIWVCKCHEVSVYWCLFNLHKYYHALYNTLQLTFFNVMRLWFIHVDLYRSTLLILML